MTASRKASKTSPKTGPSSGWLSLDELLLAGPVPPSKTRVGESIVGDPTGGGGGDGDGGCCCCCCCRCCCCCCCKPEPPPEQPPEPPPVDLVTPTVSLSAGGWEQLVDPADLGAGVQAVRGELRWRARGPQGTEVVIEARTEGPDGSASGRYGDWTVVVGPRSSVDAARIVVERGLGATVRLRARATSSAGEVGYSAIVSLRLG